MGVYYIEFKAPAADGGRYKSKRNPRKGLRPEGPSYRCGRIQVRKPG